MHLRFTKQLYIIIVLYTRQKQNKCVLKSDICIVCAKKIHIFMLIRESDRFKQVRELLYQTTPISKDDLAMEYEVRYGVKKETVLANFFGEIDVYLNNRIFCAYHKCGQRT